MYLRDMYKVSSEETSQESTTKAVCSSGSAGAGAGFECIRNAPRPKEGEDISHLSSLDPKLQVELVNRALWEEFATHTTEMVVTKPGRRLFPTLNLKIKGMDASTNYYVIMDIVNVSGSRYRYQNQEWVTYGAADPPEPPTCYIHPWSPSLGNRWMREAISFRKVKITKTLFNFGPEKLFIHSMHRYQPRVHIMRADDVSATRPGAVSTFSFGATGFVSVTSYQNINIVNLKVKYNPFARGYRDMRDKSALEVPEDVDEVFKLQCEENCDTPRNGLVGTSNLLFPAQINRPQTEEDVRFFEAQQQRPQRPYALMTRGSFPPRVSPIGDSNPQSYFANAYQQTSLASRARFDNESEAVHRPNCTRAPCTCWALTNDGNSSYSDTYYNHQEIIENGFGRYL